MPIPITTETTPTAERPAQRSPLVTAGGVGLAAIWIAVVVICVFSPDLVSGSEQDHLALAAMLTWVWGLIASRSLVVALLAERTRPGPRREVWRASWIASPTASSDRRWRTSAATTST